MQNKLFDIRVRDYDEFGGGVVFGSMLGVAVSLIFFVLLLLFTGGQSSNTLDAGFAEYPAKEQICAVGDNNTILGCFDSNILTEEE